MKVTYLGYYAAIFLLCLTGCENPSNGPKGEVVYREVVSLAVNTPDQSGYRYGDFETASATVWYLQGYTNGYVEVVSDTNVTWAGGNEDGTITFDGFGDHTLTATSNEDASFSDTVTFSVTDIRNTSWGIIGTVHFIFFEDTVEIAYPSLTTEIVPYDASGFPSVAFTPNTTAPAFTSTTLEVQFSQLVVLYTHGEDHPPFVP